MEALKKLLRTLYRTAIITLVGFACLGAAYIGGYLPKAVELREVVKTIAIEEPEMTREQLIAEAPSAGMPSLVAEILLEQEDAGQYRKNAKRCEWTSEDWLARARKIEPHDKEQQEAYRCSYGPFQTAGWHAPRYGMVWSDLLKPRNNLEVAAAVWGNCFEAAQKNTKNADPYTIYRTAFRCYNGSGPRAERYADKAMAQLARIATNKLLSKVTAAS